MQIIRTTNPNGTYRYDVDGETIYKASRVLYTHASTYTVAGSDPLLFHKTANAANKARGYNGWTKTSVVEIVDGDAVELGEARAESSEIAREIAATVTAEHPAIEAAMQRKAAKSDAAPAQLAPRVIDQWETHDGETYAYDVEGNRVIEIGARTRASRWNVASNIRSWAVIRNGVAASGRADGLRAAKREALAALVGIDAKRPERQRTPRIGTRVVPIDGPTQFRGRSGRVEARGTGDDGVMYYTVDFGNGVNWPFTANQLNVP